MQQYLDLMRHVSADGVPARADRTGTGTLSVFGHQMRFDLRRGFPLVTTKKLHVRSIVHELLWFLRGDTNVAYLRSMGSPSGTNGPMRPASSARSMARNGARGRRRDGGTIDQIAEVIAPHPQRSRFAPADRDGVEPGRCRPHGAAALPLPVPVLRREWPAFLSALSALGGCLPRRAVQHRLLCAPDAHGRACHRPEARANSSIRWAMPISIPTISNRPTSS